MSRRKIATMALVCMMMATMIALGGVTANPPGGDQPTGGQPGVPGPFPTAGPPAPRPDTNPLLVEAPPLANLRIRSLRADRQDVTVGDLVTFRIEVENVGYRLARTANVTLYAPANGSSTMVAWGVVDLWYFEGVSWLTWVPSLVGSVAVRAVADANTSIPETDETDNAGTATVNVLAGSTPGAPDLLVTETSVGVLSTPFSGTPTNLHVRVRNVGTAGANSVFGRVLVRQDDQPSALVGTYTIISLAVGSADNHVLSWVFAMDGPHRMTVIVDESDVIRELREDNNQATTGMHVQGPFEQACTQNLGEHIVPLGITQTYTNCAVVVANLTVFGTFRLVNPARLIVGKYYPPGDSLGLPGPNASLEDAHGVVVKAGGTFQVTGTLVQSANVTATMSPYAFEFVAEENSSITWTQARAVFPWGKIVDVCSPIGLAEDCDMQRPGGLVIRTQSLTFQNTTVSYGRSHGLFLDTGTNVPLCAICGVTLAGNTFRDNSRAGMALLAGSIFPPVAKHLEVEVADSSFLRNKAGLFQLGRSVGSVTSAWVNFSAMEDNVIGIEADKASFLDARNNTFTYSTLANLRFAAQEGVPQFHFLKWNVLASLPGQFGLYAWRASPLVAANEFRVDGSASEAGVRMDAVFDASPRIDTPAGYCCWTPRFAGNHLTHLQNGWRDYGVTVHDSDAFVDENDVRKVRFGSVACMRSACDVLGNVFGIASGPSIGWICQGVSAFENSSLIVTGNTFQHGGCGWDTWSVLARNSTLWMQYNPNVESQTAVWDSASLDIRNNGPIANVWIERSNGANIIDNVIYGKTMLTASSNATILRNTVSLSTWGFVLEDDSRDALIERNDITSSAFYPRGQPPADQAADMAHIAIYTNSSAVIRHNVMRRGAWGISLDDIRPGNVPLFRDTYAYIEGNWIEDNGFVGIGVDATTRADILENSLNRSNGWAIQVESGHPGNTVIGNWVNDTYGYINQGCDWTAIWLSSENHGPNRFGSVEVAWNRILTTNGTGIRYCEQKNVYIHNNTIDNTGSNHNVTGITLSGVPIGGLSMPARVENNTVTGFAYGVWVKNSATTNPNAPGHDLGYNRIADNLIGIQVGWGDAWESCPTSPLLFQAVGTWSTLHHNVIEANGIGVNASAAHDTWYCPYGGGYNRTVMFLGRPTLRGNWIANGTEGVRVRSYVTRDLPGLAGESPWVDASGNTIENNVQGVHLEGAVFSGSTYAVYADLDGNNTVTGNTYGVWLHGPTTDLTKLRVWWNDLRNNTNQGVHVEGDPFGTWGDYFHAECNWWGDAGGPDDDSPGLPDQLNNDPGQDLSDFVYYREPPGGPLWWLNQSAAQDTVCAP